MTAISPKAETGRPSCTQLFYGFFRLGITAFGGALPLARRMLVEKERWLTGEEFTDLLGLCQFLPGGNVINMSVAVGARFHGPRGAFAALMGLILAPSLIVIMLGSVYQRYESDPHIQHMFAGLAAAAAGLLISMAVKIAKPLRGNGPGIAIALACFAAIAVLRLPLLPTMLVLTPLSIFLTLAVAPMMSVLISLAIIFTQLSLLAFGGGNTILPEMQRQVVEVHQWMSAAEFGALFALGQAAPGPNLMVVTLVGWHVAGWMGMLVTTVAKFGPSSVVVVLVLRLWERFKDKPWRAVAQAGIFPMTAGLMAASAALITQASVHSWVTAAIAGLVALTATLSRLHPLWLLAAGALAGLAGGG